MYLCVKNAVPSLVQQNSHFWPGLLSLKPYKTFYFDELLLNKHQRKLDLFIGDYLIAHKEKIPVL